MGYVLTTADRDLLVDLDAEPLLLSPYSQHPDREQLEKLVGYGWLTAVYYRHGGTIYRYKGLESAVVILTENDQLYDTIQDQLHYVGLSRARHHAVVIGDLPKPNVF